MLYADPAAFLAVAEPVLAADPVGTTVIGAAAQQLAAGLGDQRLQGGWFATAADTDGRVRGLAMRTGKYPPALHDLSPTTAAELADRVLASGETPDGAQAQRDSALAFAERVAAATGGDVRVERELRLHRLGTLTPPSGVPGYARRATEADLDLLVDWMRAFLIDVGDALPPPAGDEEERRAAETEEQRQRLDHAWLWIDAAGVPVALAAGRPPAFGVVRVGPVYTPSNQRGHGYAAAVTAHMSAVARDGGSEVVLFTDLANPTSNGVYRRIGFAPVGDRVSVRVVRG